MVSCGKYMSRVKNGRGPGWPARVDGRAEMRLTPALLTPCLLTLEPKVVDASVLARYLLMAISEIV